MANGTAANAAALAAFNAVKKKEASSKQTDICDLPAALRSQSKIRTPTSQSQSRVSTPSSVANRKYGNYSDTSSISPKPPLKLETNVRSPSASSPSSEFDGESESDSFDYFNLGHNNSNRGDALRSPRSPRYSPQTPRDMISHVKNSIDSKAILNDASAKRLSNNYAPQEMLKNLKHSLNEKARPVNVLPRPVENEKGVDFLSDMRDRLDNTRKVVANNKSLKPGLKLESDNQLDDEGFYYYQQPGNGSYSSFESAASELENRGKRETREIREIRENSVRAQLPPQQPTPDSRRVSVEKEANQVSQPSTPDLHGISIDVTDHDAEKNDDNEVLTRVPLKIPENDKATASSRNTTRRKPPPKSDDELDIKDDTDDASTLNSELRQKTIRNGRSAETFSSGEGFNHPDDIASITDTDEPVPPRVRRKESKFPQFPDIRKHHHHSKHLFRHKHHSHKAPDTMPLSEADSEYTDAEASDAGYTSSNPAPLKVAPTMQQPVQFRTTMRKPNKRKDKSSKFDEYKPWKSHNDLNYLTDQERKRYEGVWVSNKGNYMDLMVTKLHGVNYALSGHDKTSSEHLEDSIKAALVSTNQAETKNESEGGGNTNTTTTSTTTGGAKQSDNGASTEKIVETDNRDRVEVNQLMLGAVVKRIWNRSKLPGDTLEQIWNLVDYRRDGTLSKNEFLVGMWLVDQCLYGRKLPKKIEPVVWESLGGIGVNVKKLK
ncbi:uncharacterized protein LODBEIA_P33790 [Lodderomyces beijingensis]|uniref:EH domain-containing protein n=1 Tax=Lodderomyces beijingensis TaxID=1775926 RepID=A0ABP0ZPL8_9ASCO